MTTFTLSLDYDYPAALLEPDSDGLPGGSTSSSIGRARSSAPRPGARQQHTIRVPLRGMEDAYQLRARGRDAAPGVVEEEVLPRALPLLEAYQTVWVDVDQFAGSPA